MMLRLAAIAACIVVQVVSASNVTIANGSAGSIYVLIEGTTGGLVEMKSQQTQTFTNTPDTTVAFVSNSTTAGSPVQAFVVANSATFNYTS
ncbi:hypothetical protein EMPS_02127 [Entomortierella parvispora]|uniref:Uncharacterized protein n=1 Tax=Entomortierella parvispora TaxID=205924 RepID=A0A9P3H461_9FUNG|nr:hypothetical protein EMPS_02127 [Entomortierella parvispora]